VDLRVQVGQLTDVVGDGVEKGAGNIVGGEGLGLGVGRGRVRVRVGAAGFGLGGGCSGCCSGGTLHAKDLAEGGRNGRVLETNLAVVCAVDVADEHVHLGIVTVLGMVEHVVEGGGSGEQGEQAPERTASERGTADTLEGSRAGDFEERDAGADVDEEVWVYVFVGRDEVDGVGLGIGKDFAGYFGNEEVET
jgi:hypothetical protein